MNSHIKFVTHIKILLCDNNSCSYLRSLQDDIEHSTETSLNTSHLGILLTPWSGNRVSSYCTPNSAHTYLHSACITKGDRARLNQLNLSTLTASHS